MAGHGWAWRGRARQGWTWHGPNGANAKGLPGMTDRHIKITVVVSGDEPRSIVYDTRDQKVFTEGSLYPRDLLFMSQLVDFVKREQKQGPRHVGAE